VNNLLLLVHLQYVSILQGQYRNNKTRNEVTVTRGEPLPRTPKPGQRYTRWPDKA